jgi:hypothetical protein
MGTHTEFLKLVLFFLLNLVSLNGLEVLDYFRII